MLQSLIDKCQYLHTYAHTSVSILLFSGTGTVSVIVADDFSLSDLRGLPLFLAEKQTEAELA